MIISGKFMHKKSDGNEVWTVSISHYVFWIRKRIVTGWGIYWRWDGKEGDYWLLTGDDMARMVELSSNHNWLESLPPL